MRGIALFASMSLVACTQHDVDNAGRTLASAAPQLANDGIVVARVEAQLVRIDADSALHVAVSSHDGTVRLSGKVKTADIATRYVAAARAVPGVTRVTATLKPDAGLPKTGDTVSDFGLVAAVRASLVAQAGVNALALDVKAHAGAVVLSGSVKTQALRETLRDAAKATRGVRSVDDRLVVRP